MGYALMAIGTNAYGEWAYNMARSLKHYSDRPVYLLHDGRATASIDTSIFDATVLMDRADTHRGGKLNPSYAKLRMSNYFELFPKWKQLLYLDVDGLCIADPEPLFAHTEPFKIQCVGATNQESGVYRNMQWMEIGRFRQIFGKPTGAIPASNSSIILVNRSDEAEQVFSDALEYYYHFEKRYSPAQLHIRWGRSRGADVALPDELFWNAALTGKNFDYSLGIPIFFMNKHTKKEFVGVDGLRSEGFYFMGFYGNEKNNSTAYSRAYDEEAKRLGGIPKAWALLKKKFINFN